MADSTPAAPKPTSQEVFRQIEQRLNVDPRNSYVLKYKPNSPHADLGHNETNQTLARITHRAQVGDVQVSFTPSAEPGQHGGSNTASLDLKKDIMGKLSAALGDVFYEKSLHNQPNTHLIVKIVDRIGAIGEGVRSLKASPLLNMMAIAHEGLSYGNHKDHAEAELTAMLKMSEMPKLSATAIKEYGEIFAGAKMEQAAGMDSHGFSKFLEWGKKYEIPLEAMVKLNPTKRTTDELEQGLLQRGALIASADPITTVRSDVPDIRAKSRDNGLA